VINRSLAVQSAINAGNRCGSALSLATQGPGRFQRPASSSSLRLRPQPQPQPPLLAAPPLLPGRRSCWRRRRSLAGAGAVDVAVAAIASAAVGLAAAVAVAAAVPVQVRPPLPAPLRGPASLLSPPLPPLPPSVSAAWWLGRL